MQPREENGVAASNRAQPITAAESHKLASFARSSDGARAKPYLHLPLTHLPAHTVPQSPQFCSSTLTFVQTAAPPPAAGHDLKPPAQAHWLALQISPLSHFIPQPPQLAGLLTVLVQTGGVPHSSVFCGQPQIPPAQTRPPLQTMPQPPQLLASVSVDTQAFAHLVSPAAQSVLHAPCEQTCVLLHAVAHLPQ